MSRQAAGITNQVTSWLFDHYIGMRLSTRMMMTRIGRIPERRAVERAVLAMTMTMTMVRVRRTHRAVRKGLGKGREQSIGRGQGRRLRTGRGKGKGWRRETSKGTVLLNKPQGEAISLVPLLCSCRWKFQWQTWIWRAK